MFWEISKEFDFCYGHRVWSQVLDQEFAMKTCFTCRHLHGHQGKIIIHLQSDVLQEGMVTDFGHLNWFKQFLDDTLDHKFLIDIHDPLFETLLPHFSDKKNLIDHDAGFKTVDFSVIQQEPRHIFEMYEGYIIVDFVPTSENISTWLMEIIQEKMNKIGVRVSSVEFLETPKSKSVVYAKPN
ncbi:6-carboxytetrahydropterin synthase [Sulfurospirillum sp. 1612]|uniref:6-carboxytetrahydropterin synthase n=1 Tax=Sulfurospirillum sp. 1612 TaxID=3094835 RepID=UPI002F9422A9